MNPGTWFEIPVLDMDRAERFYGAVFGFTFDRRPEMDGILMSWFPMAEGMNTYGAGGALVRHAMLKPSADGTTIYLSTKSIEESLEKIEAGGGKMIMPKKDIGEYGYIAMFIDSEGNKVALHTAK